MCECTLQYGGNPVSCAIALAVLDVIEKEALRQHGLEVGQYLADQLEELGKRHPIIGQVRCGESSQCSLLT